MTTLAAGTAAAVLLAAQSGVPAQATPLRVEKSATIGFDRPALHSGARPKLKLKLHGGSAFPTFYAKHGHGNEGAGGVRGGGDESGGGSAPIGSGPSVPEPTAALLFGLGLLATRAAAVRRSAAR